MQHQQQQQHQQVAAAHMQGQQPHQQMLQPNFAYPGYQYGYYAQPGPVQVGFPSAQHATGTPLYANHHHVQMYVPASPYYQYHPSMMYPQMVPAEYAALIDANNKDDGSPEPSGGQHVQPMWHPAPMGWHPTMGPPLTHAEEFLPADEMDEYNQYQAHAMEHQSPQVLSPVYAKDEHGYHGIHPHQEFIAACNINPHLAQQQQQPIVDPNQHHNMPQHHALQHPQLHQQSPQMQVHHQEQQQHHQQQQPPHLVAMPQQLIMHPVDNNNLVINEYISDETIDENTAVSGNVLVTDIISNPLSNQPQQQQHTGTIDHSQAFNNNYEFDKSMHHDASNNVTTETLNQSAILIAATPTIPSVDQQSVVYVTNAVPTATAPASTVSSSSSSTVHTQHDNISPKTKQSHNNHHNNNNNHHIESKQPPSHHHHNPFAQQPPIHSTNIHLSNSSINSTTSSLSHGAAPPSSVPAMSTEDLEKLTASTNDMFITKHERADRSSDFNPKLAHSNHNNNNNNSHHNNNNHHINHKNSNASWNYHKKNTVNVSVSAVPMHNSTTVLLPTPKQPLIAHTPTHRSDYGNRSQSPSVPKSYVPKQHQQHHNTATPSTTTSTDNHHHSAKFAHSTQSIEQPLPKPVVATTSIASTAVPQQLQQHEQRSKQVEVIPQHLLHNETPSAAAATGEPAPQAALHIPVASATPLAEDKALIPSIPVAPREDATTVHVQLPSPAQAAISTAATPAAVPPGTPSWASLFASKARAGAAPHLDPVGATTKKAIAKVAPFESPSPTAIAAAASLGNAKPTTSVATTIAASTNVSPSGAQAQFVSDETAVVVVAPKPAMSYSAASSQGLTATPVAQHAKKSATKTVAASAVAAVTKPVATNDETSSMKLGGEWKFQISYVKFCFEEQFFSANTILASLFCEEMFIVRVSF